MAGYNHSNAFATISPIKQNMGDIVTDIENQNFRYRAEQREQERIKQEQEEKDQLKVEKLRERILKTPTLNSTGVQSLDELNGRVLRQAIERKYEIYKKLSEGGLTIEEQTALEVENKNIDNLPENLKLGNDNIQNWFANYDKQVADGTAWSESKIDNRRKNGFDAFVPTLDERGLPLIGYRDLDGDGEIDPLPWENIKDGIVFGPLMEKFDYNKLVDGASKILGTKEITDQNGYTTTIIKQVPLENIEQYANSLLFKDGDISPFVLSRAREKGYGFNSKDLSDDEIDNIKQELIKDIKLRTNYSFSEKTDLAAEDRDLNRNQKERFHNDQKELEKEKLLLAKRAAKAKGESTPEVGETTRPSINVWGEQFYNKIGKNYRSVPINGKVSLRSIPTNKKNDNGEQLIISNPTVENYTYNNNGRLLLDVSFVDTPENKSSGQSEVRKKHQFVASDETEATVAYQLGMSVEELRKKAKGNNEAASFGL